MKSGLLFSFTTGGLSIVFLLISANFVMDLSTETISHLLWFFIIYAVAGVMIFPFAAALVRPLSIARIWKILIYLALGLAALNIPLGAQENEWITIDTIRDLIHRNPGAAPNLISNIGVFHLLPLLAFSISLFLFRDRLLDSQPQPPAGSQ